MNRRCEKWKKEMEILIDVKEDLEKAIDDNKMLMNIQDTYHLDEKPKKKKNKKKNKKNKKKN